jgi:hypothetical protein
MLINPRLRETEERVPATPQEEKDQDPVLSEEMKQICRVLIRGFKLIVKLLEALVEKR